MQRVNIRAAHAIELPLLFKGGLAVDGLAQGVDDPPAQKLAYPQSQLPAGVAHKIAGGNAVHIRIGHQQDVVVFEPHHLRRHLAAGIAVVNAADIAHRRPAAGSLDGHSHDIFNFARQAVCFRILHLAYHLPEYRHENFLLK